MGAVRGDQLRVLHNSSRAQGICSKRSSQQMLFTPHTVFIRRVKGLRSYVTYCHMSWLPMPQQHHTVYHIRSYCSEIGTCTSHHKADGKVEMLKLSLNLLLRLTRWHVPVLTTCAASQKQCSLSTEQRQTHVHGTGSAMCIVSIVYWSTPSVSYYLPIYPPI